MNLLVKEANEKDDKIFDCSFGDDLGVVFGVSYSHN